MYIGTFILTVRCDQRECPSHDTIHAQNFSTALHEARRRGWYIKTHGAQRRAKCPSCQCVGTRRLVEA